MTTTKISLGNAIGTFIIEDLDADATGEDDVNSGAATVHEIFIDNTGNSAAATFLKLYDNTNPTVGTTDPEFILRGRAGIKTRVYCTAGIGHAMTNLSLAAVTTAGTAGTTSPTTDVIARVRIS